MTEPTIMTATIFAAFVLATLNGCGRGESKQSKPGPQRVEMVHIPAGTSIVGCGPEVPRTTEAERERFRCEPWEKSRVVELPAFDLDKIEVSCRRYLECVSLGACPKDDIPPCAAPKKPASVKFDSARAYCRSVGKRLPTSDEWERAARGSDARAYPWGNEVPTCEHANFESCRIGKADVDEILPKDTSPFGALHLGGNVKEWATGGIGPFGKHYEHISKGYPYETHMETWKYMESTHAGIRCTRSASDTSPTPRDGEK